jgi:hypothetical protein
MSAYIYKLISPRKFTWMKVQVDSNTTAIHKVYHMQFWYKPYADMEDDKKLQKKLSREEAKTKELFEGVDVEYAITTYEGSISKPFTHGDFFGCWQVVAWKKLKNIEGEIASYPASTNRILFNDESFSNVWHKAVLADKEDIYDHLTSPGIKVLEQRY